MRSLALLVALAFVAVPVAGCFSKDTTPPAYAVKATGGKVGPGWAYDGAGITGGDATLDGVVHNADNTGAIYANYTYHGAKWAVVFDHFAEASGKTFQDGGVAFGLTEHGDTGVADASIPKVHGKLVAYGTATVTKDGVVQKGKTSDAWAAHLMVYDDAIRGPDGKITKADGTTPYDPKAPADAKTYPGMAQAMLKLVSPDGDNATRAATHVDKNVSIGGPNAAVDVDVPFEMGALPFSISVNSTSAAPGPAPAPAPSVGAAQVTITVKVGNKTLTDGPASIVPGTPYTHKFDIKAEDLAGATGPAKVTISGSGAANFEVTADVAYADDPFMVVTWDNPTLT